MTQTREHVLREAQLGFIGTILATLSHELKNHLAIVKEYSGLVQDLAEMGKMPAAGTAEQCVNAVQCIHRQIDGTLGLLGYFNRFSHRMDTSQSVYAVNEAVEELLALMHRLTNQRKIRVEKDFHETLSPVTGNPALLQFSLFCLIQEAMGRLEDNGGLILKTGAARDAVTISLVAEGVMREGVNKHPACAEEALNEALQHLDGRISRAGSGREATLTIPIATSTA